MRGPPSPSTYTGRQLYAREKIYRARGQAEDTKAEKYKKGETES